MEFVVNVSCELFSDVPRISWYGGWHVLLENMEYYKIDPQIWKLKHCSSKRCARGLDNEVGLEVPCLYEDDCVEIYDFPFGYVANYDGFICYLYNVKSDSASESKFIYRGKKGRGSEMRFVTAGAKLSKDEMYEVIPSFIVGGECLVKTVNNEMKLYSSICDELFKVDYPVKYVDDFIKLMRKFGWGEEGKWLFRRLGRLKYNLEALLNDRKVIERLLMM